MTENRSVPPWSVPVIFLAGTLLAVGTLNNELGSLHGDNARYILLAKSLATGQGYRSIYEPGSPLHTFNPFGFPLLLTPIVALWGARAFLAMHALVVGWALLCLFLWYAWVRREATPWVAGASLCALATTPLWVEWYGQILSEFPYLAFSLLALLWLRRGGSWGVTALWLLAAFFTRTVGIVLILAVLLHLPVTLSLSKGDFRRASTGSARTAVAVLLPILAWAAWCAWAPGGPEGTYPSLFWMADPFRPDLGGLTLGALGRRIAENALFYLTILGQVLVWPTTQAAPWVSVGIGALLAVGVGIGFARRLGRQGSAADWTVAATAVLFLAWPGHEPRFLLPVLPWIWLYLLEAGARLRWGRGVGIALIAGNLAGSLWVVGLNAVGVRYRPGFQGFVAAHEWLRTNAPPEAVIMSRQYPVTALLADRRAVGFPFTSKQAQILDTLRQFGVTHVLDDGLFPETQGYLVPVIRAHLDWFEPEMVRFGSAHLLRVRKEIRLTSE